MQVIYVIDSLESGGAERSLVDLIAPLTAAGVRLEVVTLGPPGVLGPRAQSAGAAVTALGGSGRADRVRHLRSLLGARSPAVVHTTLFEANVIGRVAASSLGLALVSSVVNTPYGPDHLADPNVSAPRLRAAQALDAFTARLVWRFHAPAQATAEVMSRRLAIPRERFEVVPRARDVAVLGFPGAQRRRQVRDALGLDAGARVVLALARHEPTKGLDVLVDAVDRLVQREDRASDLVVLIAGREGNETPRLRQQIEGLARGERIRLLGFRDDVGDLLAAADLYVLASRREGFPGSVLEAMAMEVPVVATDLPGTREALGPFGVVVPVDDPVALGDALAATLADPGRAGAADQARRRVVDTFGPDAIARQMMALWGRARAGGPPGQIARQVHRRSVGRGRGEPPVPR